MNLTSKLTCLNAALADKRRQLLPEMPGGFMKRLILLIVVLLLVAGCVFGGIKLRAYWQKRTEPKFKTAKVTRGDIVFEVLATGTVDPILKVEIGSFVSGPIVDLLVDFNQQVEEGELLAKIDPRRYKAAAMRDKAALQTARCRVLQINTELQRAKNDEQRAQRLREINEDYVSDTEMDQFMFARQGLEAQLLVAEQSVKQSEAQLSDSELNLGYTDILAPTSGTIIDRLIDPGQTLAAQFQTPQLFVLAPDMKERMWVLASVVEADIGYVIRAQEEERPVYFTVDAYEDELFEGVIVQVRKNPAAEQNVVTYPVVVETPNPDLKLLPGMTANLSFEVERRENVLRIPAAAIRFLPDVKYVNEADKKLIEGEEEADEEDNVSTSARDRVEVSRRRRRRHVWVKDGEILRSIPIEFGIFAGGHYELVSGELEEGQELITDVE
jgi:HlyD family secretion protein